MDEGSGSLEDGKRADIAVFGLDGAFAAHQSTTGLMRSCTPRRVSKSRTVLVDGRS
jgi:cytosine/adenosine deaminase-related metal-dependent hydrolase